MSIAQKQQLSRSKHIHETREADLWNPIVLKRTKQDKLLSACISVFQPIDFRKSTNKNKQNGTTESLKDKLKGFQPSRSKPGESTEIALQCAEPDLNA